MIVFLIRACRVKEPLGAEHSFIFPVVALKEWKSNGHLSLERLPRQGPAQGGTQFHLAASRNCSGRNTVPSCRVKELLRADHISIFSVVAL
jgi:hypothetical protein